MVLTVRARPHVRLLLRRTGPGAKAPLETHFLALEHRIAAHYPLLARRDRRWLVLPCPRRHVFHEVRVPALRLRRERAAVASLGLLWQLSIVTPRTRHLARHRRVEPRCTA